eukprot:7145933-Ditylum_brightwellii.AAC.2
MKDQDVRVVKNVNPGKETAAEQIHYGITYLPHQTRVQKTQTNQAGAKGNNRVVSIVGIIYDTVSSNKEPRELIKHQKTSENEQAPETEQKPE